MAWYADDTKITYVSDAVQQFEPEPTATNSVCIDATPAMEPLSPTVEVLNLQASEPQSARSHHTHWGE